ncbi:MAG TPA: CDP-alcohol phosphatidyltransferase family protein [Steroidobacteraceae bacterium]|nr:CDP-alcohol phosphatidyltransferase family protein [Steroidobacteraceae bacterium]
MSIARAARHAVLRSALISILPAALATGAAAQLLGQRLDLDAAYLPKAAAVFIAGAALVLIGLPRHHPFASFGAANQVTTARGALIALLAALIAERADTGAPRVALAIGTTIVVLDGVDGWLARRDHMTSAFGARFDMEADAALILVLAVLAWQFGKAGAWVLASGLLRYAFVAAGLGVPYLRNPLPPSRRRKLVAVLQVVALLLTIAPFVPATTGAYVAAAGLCALTLSFVADVLRLSSR